MRHGSNISLGAISTAGISRRDAKYSVRGNYEWPNISRHDPQHATSTPAWPPRPISRALILLVSMAAPCSGLRWLKAPYYRTLSLHTSAISKGQWGGQLGANQCFFKVTVQVKGHAAARVIESTPWKFTQLRGKLWRVCVPGDEMAYNTTLKTFLYINWPRARLIEPGCRCSGCAGMLEDGGKSREPCRFNFGLIFNTRLKYCMRGPVWSPVSLLVLLVSL